VTVSEPLLSKTRLSPLVRPVTDPPIEVDAAPPLPQPDSSAASKSPANKNGCFIVMSIKINAPSASPWYRPN